MNPGVIASEDLTERAYILGLSFPYLEESGDELKRLDLDRLLYTLDEITLPYSDNTFTIHFAGARKSGSPEVRYLYMLEGVDKTWIPASGSEVTYTDLSPGTYTFSCVLIPDRSRLWIISLSTYRRPGICRGWHLWSMLFSRSWRCCR